MGALLALTSSLLWGTSDFLGGTASRRLPTFVVILWTQGFALLLLLPFVVAAAVPADAAPFLWGGVGGLTGVVGLSAFYTGLASGTMGVVAPITAAGAVVPVLTGLSRGERPGGLQVIGIVASLAGVVLASGPDLHAAGTGRRAGAARPVLLAAVAALAFGSVAVMLAEGSRASVAWTLLSMRASTVAVLAAGFALVRRLPRVRRRDLGILLPTGALDVSANAAYAVATTVAPLTVVGTLGSMYPVVTVLLAREVHHERLTGIQWAGVVTAVSGVVLIGAGG